MTGSTHQPDHCVGELIMIRLHLDKETSPRHVARQQFIYIYYIINIKNHHISFVHKKFSIQYNYIQFQKLLRSICNIRINVSLEELNGILTDICESPIQIYWQPN